MNVKHAASWVIREKSIGNPVMETYSRKLAESINTEKYEAVPIIDHLWSINQREQIRRSLVESGWCVSDEMVGALARKKYETIVGWKEANVWLRVKPDVMILTAEYWSEGNNALSTLYAHIDKGSDRTQIHAQVMSFAKDIDDRVAQTYAARLLRPAAHA